MKKEENEKLVDKLTIIALLTGVSLFVAGYLSNYLY